MWRTPCTAQCVSSTWLHLAQQLMNPAESRNLVWLQVKGRVAHALPGAVKLAAACHASQLSIKALFRGRVHAAHEDRPSSGHDIASRCMSLVRSSCDP